jgi:hypothetical protein
MKHNIAYAVDNSRLNHKEVHDYLKQHNLIYMSYNSFKDVMSSYLDDMQKKPSRGAQMLLYYLGTSSTRFFC